MATYVPVTVVASGGAPFVQVSGNAPPMTVVDNAAPITLVANNAPPVVLYNPDGTPYTGGGVPKLALNSRMGAIGDSITATRSIDSWWEWVKVALNGRYFESRYGNVAVSNETTTQMRNARLASAIAQLPKVCTVLGGTNDLGNTSDTVATITGNLRYMYDQLIAAGAKVVAGTIMPRFGSSVLSGPREVDRQTVNTWVRAQTDITVVDLDAMTAAMMKGDGLHPNVVGARYIASQFLPALAGLIDAGSILLPANDPSNLIVNPTFAGNVVVPEGEVASNWTLAVPAGATGRVAVSRGLMADGVTPAQIFALSGLPSAISLMTFTSDAFTINGVSNDKFEIFAPYEMDAVKGILGFSMDLQGGGVAQAFNNLTASVIVNAANAVTTAGVLRARPIDLSGTQAQVTARFCLNLYNNGGDIGGGNVIGGTIKIGRPFVRKVNTL